MKNCIICNKEFISKVGNQKCCSDECRKQHNINRRKNGYQKVKENFKISVCTVCGNEFKEIIRLDRKQRIFCSRSCASKYYILDGTYDSWRNHVTPLVPRVSVICAGCGKELQRTEADILRHKLYDNEFCCDVFCIKKYRKKLAKLGHYKGKPFTKEMQEKQKATLLKNHNVTNAFMLAKHRTKSKPQIEVYNWLAQTYKNFEFEIEKKVNDYFVDIISFKNNIVIEFNGDFWHCNPKIYNENDFNPKKLLLAKEIWEQDLYRQKQLEEVGYNIYVVWELDYRNDTWKEDLIQWLKQYE